MIGTGFRIVFLLVLGLIASWGTLLFFPELCVKAERTDQEIFTRAFPERAGSLKRKVASLQLPLWRDLLPLDQEQMSDVASVVARRMAVSGALLPLGLVFIAMSFLAGLILRERLHLGTAYASPTAAFLAKRLGEGAVTLFLLSSLSPLPLPYGLFYPLLLSAMVGTTTYVANLPLRV